MGLSKTWMEIMGQIFRRALIWGSIGGVLAFLFYLLSLITDAFASLEIILWPASLAFMALDNSTTTRSQWIGGTALLIVANFVLYFIVAVAIILSRRAIVRLVSQ
jgi:hypothetical protein